MKKIGYILLSAMAFAFACNKPEEEKPQPKPEPVVPKIEIPAESQAVFSQGISLEAGTSAQSQTVKFSTTAAWTADVTDVKASTWLSVSPTSGSAGSVTLTLTAQPNTGKPDREAAVTIKCGTVSQKFSVKQAGIPDVDVTSVTLDKDTLELVEGDEAQLSATVKPDDATDKTVTWSTDKADVATVDESGKVTALKEGMASIIAKAGAFSDTCVVTVAKKVIPVESVALSQKTLELVEGDEAQLTATVTPDDAADPTVTWSTDKAEIATVDQAGKVTAVKEGTVSIIAQAGEKADTCKLTVAKRIIPVASVTLDKSSLELVEGDEATLTATVKPDDATDKTVTWSSSDASVATVADGKVVAVAPGSAVITATAGEQSAACTVKVEKRFIPVTSVTLDKTSIELVEGDEATLTATVKPDDATDKTLTWSTSDASVAAVAGGKVVAVAPGSAVITAKAGEQSATCTVSVTKRYIPVSGITLDNTAIALEEGQEAQLKATVLPENATEPAVSWSVDKPEVATVDGTGKVKALAEGTAVVTATAGDKSATCTVTVAKALVPATSVTLNKSSLDLFQGEAADLVATVAPSNTTDQVQWSSSNPDAVTVSSAGRVNAVAVGTAVITAKAGEKSATCTVTVKAVVPVSSVKLDKAELALEKGKSETLTATVKPDDATYKTVTWSSDNSNVATVSATGVVRATGGGQTRIRAKAGNQEAVCKVSVTVPATGVSLNKQEITLGVGANETLVAKVAPDDATDKSVSWKSDKPEYVTVDDNGKVTAVAEGNAVITVTTHNGKNASCTVHVVIPDTGVTLDQSAITLNRGANQTLVATVQPGFATNKNVSWSSSKTSVATVNSSGKVTAVGSGEAVITVKTAYGHTASCNVTVVVPVEGVSLNKETHTMAVESTFTLEATVSPGDATDKSVSWEVEGSAYVTIQASGSSCQVTAVAVGTATVTVKTANGKTASCTFTILEEDPTNTEGYGSGEGQWDD